MAAAPRRQNMGQRANSRPGPTVLALRVILGLTNRRPSRTEIWGVFDSRFSDGGKPLAEGAFVAKESEMNRGDSVRPEQRKHEFPASGNTMSVPVAKRSLVG